MGKTKSNPGKSGHVVTSDLLKMNLTCACVSTSICDTCMSAGRIVVKLFFFPHRCRDLVHDPNTNPNLHLKASPYHNSQDIRRGSVFALSLLSTVDLLCIFLLVSLNTYREICSIKILFFLLTLCSITLRIRRQG